MAGEIIIDCGVVETRAALLEDGELVELHIERPYPERLVGNIYRGMVSSVLPGMQAAFIDIGYKKNAFLYVADAIPQKAYREDEEASEVCCRDANIEDILKPGQEITVQVIKEPAGTKGPRVTTHLTIPGRHLVLLPNADYVGISRRIENEEERSKLRQMAAALKPEGAGLIVRTVSEGAKEKDFQQDVNFLMKLWNSIRERERKGHVPRCLYKDMDLVHRTVRDIFTEDISKLVINDRRQYEEVLELADMISPALKLKIHLYEKDYDIFEFYNVDAKVKKAIGRKVWLKCGGYLVLDQTEALTVIDVNTGKYTGDSSLEDTVLRTNLEAAGEIARQLRLRDIGGIIIIDFIDMHKQEHQNRVIDALRQALKKDRTKTTVVGMTGLGLLEMTRKKVGQALSSVMTTGCYCCDGTGRMLAPEEIARQAEREIVRKAAEPGCKKLVVELHPTVASVFAGAEVQLLPELEARCGKKIEVKGMKDCKYEEIKITGVDTNNPVC